jgi:hypothetical protein
MQAEDFSGGFLALGEASAHGAVLRARARGEGGLEVEVGFAAGQLRGAPVARPE